MRAELAELRDTVKNLRDRQQAAMNEWAALVSRLPLA
jgi:hypothetical protein